MDRPSHDYAYGQQQPPRQAPTLPQQPQQFGFHPQHQQYQPPPPPFIPPHPQIPQFSYSHHIQQQQQQQQPPASQLHPHLSHSQMLHHQPPPPSFPHLIPPPFHPFEAPPPNDPELQKRIDKLVEYSVKNGPEFEAMIREKQQDNPAYSFLFGGEGHGYYRYKLWMSTRIPGGAYNQQFPASSLPVMHPPPNSMMAPVVGGSSAVSNASQMLQPPFQPFFDQHHQHPTLFGPHSRPPFEKGSHPMNPPSLPPDIAMEFNNIIGSLNGTKESIKSTKNWFMQRTQFSSSLAEALKERVFALEDSERQLHIIYLVNDILFEGLQRRGNTSELDTDAMAFKPVIGAMLSRVYHNPQNKDDNQSRLQKILQFWASKEVYNQESVRAIEAEMIGGHISGFPPQTITQWQPERQSVSDPEHSDKRIHPAMSPSPPFITNTMPPFPVPLPSNPSISSVLQPPPPPPPAAGEKPPPYPLFPPGLIPGMVRKMQIGSGVPYSPLSPLDIPTIIPPSDVSPSEILERVSKFFREIDESNPIEGHLGNQNDEYDGYEREATIRKGGACIPPPPNLQIDPETGAYPDGSVEPKGGSNGSGRSGLGAGADPNEPCQYDDVYTSYRKQRSTTYHSSMSARAAAR